MIQQLKQMGINPSAIHCNLSQEGWREQELNRKEGRLSDNGTVIVNTGIYTGRSPKDRFIVKTNENKDLVDWGVINQPLSEEAFESLEETVKKEMADKELFIFDGFAGAEGAEFITPASFCVLSFAERIPLVAAPQISAGVNSITDALSFL